MKWEEERPQKWIALVAFFSHLAGLTHLSGPNIEKVSDDLWLMPVKDMPPGIILDMIKEERWAEINIPFHPPIEEEEHIYGFTLFLVGKENHEIALLEMNRADELKGDMYTLYRERAESMDAAFDY